MQHDVTKINGPVSVNILTSANGKVMFYIFGDAHESRDEGCNDPNTIRLNDAGNDLSEESKAIDRARTIDITAAFYLMLKHNNIFRQPTDLFVEIPHDRSSRQVMTDKQVGEVGWLADSTKLALNQDQFSPNCSVVYADIRQNSIRGTIDILTHIGVYELSTISDREESEIVNFFDIVSILFRHYMLLFDSVCQLGALDNLRVIIAEVGNLRKSPVRDRCLESLRGMLISDSITVNGKTRYGHKIAIALERLRQFSSATRQIADKNLAYIRNEYVMIKEDLDRSNMMSEVNIAIAQRTELDEVVEMMFASHISSLSETFISMAAWFMDIYLITVSFISRKPNKVIFAGASHAKRYVDLLIDVHKCVPKVQSSNLVSYYDEETDTKVVDYSRCIHAENLVDYLDFNEMKARLY